VATAELQQKAGHSRGFAYQFYEAVEEAKIRLSTEQETSIEFHRPGFDVHTPVARTEFEALISDDINLLEETISIALSDADVDANDVVQVVRWRPRFGVKVSGRRLLVDDLTRRV
jgi:molecular chaperone DnaK (HSP70)